MRKIYENPDVFVIKIPLPGNPLRELNSYLIMSEGESLLIDTGFQHPVSLKVLKDALEEIGVNPDTMQVFLSHVHTDHIGSVCDVSNENTVIYMSEEDYGRYRQGKIPDHWKISDACFIKEGFPEEALERLAMTNPARKYMPDQIFEAQYIHDGMEIMVGNVKLICVQTNGHTPGHFSLYMPEKEIMFLGDHILYDITPNITAWLGVEDSLGDYLKNLDKMKQYPMQLALPGHREASKDIFQRIEEIKVHHQIRLDGTIKIVKEHPGLNGDQIAAQLKWSMRGKNWDEFPVEQKWFAVGETIAHLDYLRKQNVLFREMKEGIYRYYLK